MNRSQRLFLHRQQAYSLTARYTNLCFRTEYSAPNELEEEHIMGIVRSYRDFVECDLDPLLEALEEIEEDFREDDPEMTDDAHELYEDINDWVKEEAMLRYNDEIPTYPRYRVKDEYLDMWYGPVSSREDSATREKVQQEGITREEIEEIHTATWTPVDELMREVEEIHETEETECPEYWSIDETRYAWLMTPDQWDQLTRSEAPDEYCGAVCIGLLRFEFTQDADCIPYINCYQYGKEGYAETGNGTPYDLIDFPISVPASGSFDEFKDRIQYFIERIRYSYAPQLSVATITEEEWKL